MKQTLLNFAIIAVILGSLTSRATRVGALVQGQLQKTELSCTVGSFMILDHIDQCLEFEGGKETTG